MPPKKQKEPAIFQVISYPILETVIPADAVTFKRERERYELEISQKEKDGASMVPASYAVSVDPETLRSMHSMGYFDEIEGAESVETLTDDHIKSVIDNIASAASQDEPDSMIIESALSGLRMNMKIRDPRLAFSTCC